MHSRIRIVGGICFGVVAVMCTAIPLLLAQDRSRPFSAATLAAIARVEAEIDRIEVRRSARGTQVVLACLIPLPPGAKFVALRRHRELIYARHFPKRRPARTTVGSQLNGVLVANLRHRASTHVTMLRTKSGSSCRWAAKKAPGPLVGTLESRHSKNDGLSVG